MKTNEYHLKRRERFNNQVLLDLAYLLIDKCHVRVIQVGLVNHAANVNLNNKIDKVLDSEYTLDYLQAKQPKIRFIKLVKDHPDDWIEIKRNGKLIASQKQLFKKMKQAVKAYFRGY